MAASARIETKTIGVEVSVGVSYTRPEQPSNVFFFCIVRFRTKLFRGYGIKSERKKKCRLYMN